MLVDDIIAKARDMIAAGAIDEPVQVRKSSLSLLLAEISNLRKALDASLPDDDRHGQSPTDARDTARAAAYDVFPRSGKQRYRVLKAIADSDDGLTDAEVAEHCGLMLHSETPRRYELYWGGWVEDSGRRRPTGMGGEGIVWVPTEKARIALQERAA